MKRPGKKLHRAINVFSALILVTVALASPALPASSSSAATPAAVGVRAGRQQLGLAGSGSVVVWEDRAVVRTPGVDSFLGTSNIRGFDFSTNQPLTITTGSGDQTMPTVADSVVVWQDNAQSNPGGERDIRAKDLKTGIEYAVATGPADQAFPATDGHSVAWLEYDGTTQSLVSADLDGKNRQIIAVSPAGSSLGGTAISLDLIVWIEHTVRDRTIHSVIRSYDRANGTTQTVGETDWTGASFALSGRRVVWTDPRLLLWDPATATSSVLSDGPVSSPSIAGDLAVWSGNAAGDPTASYLYGLDLKTGVRKALVIGSNEQAPVVAGNQLLWQSDVSGQWGLFSLPLPQVLAAPVTVATSPGATSAATTAAVQPAGTWTRPKYKGIHVANGDVNGWYFGSPPNPCTSNGCPAVDALGGSDTNSEPFFGSFVVNQTDLTWNTGRPAPWGPLVNGAMKNVQNNWGATVVVRTWPRKEYDKPTDPPEDKYSARGTTYPRNDKSTNPDMVTQEIIALVKPDARAWVKNVQVENEPNLKWPIPYSTQWGSHPTFTWADIFDPQLYQAIDAWYVDVKWSIDWWKYNYTDPDPAIQLRVQNRMKAITYWGPPVSDIYDKLGPARNQGYMYDYMGNMLSSNFYGRLAYHVYPAPNGDARAGYLVNNSYGKDFPTWLKQAVDNPTGPGGIPSIITEFGWNPGQMRDCSKTQHDTWPIGTGLCATNDVRAHTFQADVAGFLANERHGASVVAVWLVRGTPPGEPDHDGMVYNQGNNTATVYSWLQDYQWSTP